MRHQKKKPLESRISHLKIPHFLQLFWKNYIDFHNFPFMESTLQTLTWDEQQDRVDIKEQHLRSRISHLNFKFSALKHHLVNLVWPRPNIGKACYPKF